MIKTKKLEREIRKFAKKHRLMYSISKGCDDTIGINLEPKENRVQVVQGFRND